MLVVTVHSKATNRNPSFKDVTASSPLLSLLTWLTCQKCQSCRKGKNYKKLKKSKGQGIRKGSQRILSLGIVVWTNFPVFPSSNFSALQRQSPPHMSRGPKVIELDKFCMFVILRFSNIEHEQSFTSVQVWTWHSILIHFLKHFSAALLLCLV